MLTGDLDRLLAGEIGALRPSPPAITSAGIWQPALPDSAPGTYATPIAFRLGSDPLPIATTLAAALRRAGQRGAARARGPGRGDPRGEGGERIRGDRDG